MTKVEFLEIASSLQENVQKIVCTTKPYLNFSFLISTQILQAEFPTTVGVSENKEEQAMEVDDSTPTAVRQGGKIKYTIGVNGLSVAREGMEVANPLKDGQSKFVYRNTNGNIPWGHPTSNKNLTIDSCSDSHNIQIEDSTSLIESYKQPLLHKTCSFDSLVILFCKVHTKRKNYFVQKYKKMTY